MVPEFASRLGAVVVNKDAGEVLLQCVESLLRSGVTQIVVVDNASVDGSLEDLVAFDRAVTVVPTGRNLGYGRAANIGVHHCVTEYVLICNPDLIIDPVAPRALIAALDAHRDYALVGPVITSRDGSIYPSARSFPSLGTAVAHGLIGLFRADNRFSRRYRREDNDGQSSEPDWISGACVLARRVAFESVGGFDERYFMYVEDLDLCWRLRRAGWGVGIVSDAAVLHLHGVSAARHPYQMLVAHHLSTWKFAVRSLEGGKRTLLPLIGVGLVARAATAALAQRVKRARRPSPPASERGSCGPTLR